MKANCGAALGSSQDGISAGVAGSARAPDAASSNRPK